MKGLKIERALPSNSIDIYALLQQAQEEGILAGKPNTRQLKAYYFGGLLHELGTPHHQWFLAKRGRGFLGFLHAVLIPGPWAGSEHKMFIDQVYVVPHRRKHGIGRKLLDAAKKQAEDMGIHRIEALVPSDQVEHWSKTEGAKVVRSLMEVTV